MAAKRVIRIEGKPMRGKGSLTVVVKYDPTALTITETPFGATLDLEESFILGEPGAPALPSQLVRAALPPYSDITDFQVTITKRTNVTKKPIFIAPVQEPRPAVRAKSGSKETIKKSLFASRRAETEKPTYVQQTPGITPPHLKEYIRILAEPAPTVRIAGVEHRGTATIVTFEMNPVHQNGDGIIELATEIKISLTYDSTKNEKEFGLVVGSRHYKPARNKVEAKRITDILRGEVINPDWVMDVDDLFPPFLVHYDYLIITDNQQWDPIAMAATGAVGDLVASFTRLANWKRRRGLRTRIVTITDIVNGVHGNFKSGARDLQEAIRNFLKWAYDNWNISWVLLGGDVNIVPVRLVASNCRGFIGVNTVNPPDNNKSYWNGTFLVMHVVDPGEWWPGSTPHILVNPSNGTIIPYDAAGASTAANPGWFYATDDTYSVQSPHRTQFVRVNGPAALVNTTLQWLYEWNTLSTDLYYSSLVGPHYSLPGVHDWDLLDNGVYGQHTGSADFDGVNYVADVGLGRAPVASVAEADSFVDKVLAYEQLLNRDGTLLDLNWPRRLTLVSSNFGGRIWIGSTPASPPGDNRYHHESGNPYTLINLAQVFENLKWRLFVQVTDTDIRIIPYGSEAPVTGRGWYFAKSDADLTPSELVIAIFGHVFRIAVPTEWAVVYGYSDELAPQNYCFDRTEADGSMTDQETIRKQIAADFPGVDVVNRLYEDEADLPAADAATPPIAHLTANRMRDALNLGPHFLSLSGHGSQGGCCHLGTAMAQSATNGFRLPIVYAMSCLTSDFQPEDAMCEELLQNPNGGAVAYVGYTRFGWIGVGDDFEREFYKRLKTTRHLALLNDSRFNLPSNSGTYKWTQFVQVLLGDPEMPVWVGKPQTLKVTHPADILKADQNVVVQVMTSSGVGINGAVVCLAMADDWVATATTDATGRTNLHINPPATGGMEVVVTAQDHVPYLGAITVKEKIVCKVGIICTADIICRANIICKANIICRASVLCKASVVCGLKIAPCKQKIACNLAISGCKAGIGGCPAIDPVDFKDLVDVVKESGVRDIKELAEKQNTRRVKKVISKLNPANRKALALMLKRIGKE